MQFFVYVWHDRSQTPYFLYVISKHIICIELYLLQHFKENGKGRGKRLCSNPYVRALGQSPYQTSQYEYPLEECDVPRIASEWLLSQFMTEGAT